LSVTMLSNIRIIQTYTKGKCSILSIRSGQPGLGKKDNRSVWNKRYI
jgi:hypothetical protein